MYNKIRHQGPVYHQFLFVRLYVRVDPPDAAEVVRPVPFFLAEIKENGPFITAGNKSRSRFLLVSVQEEFIALVAHGEGVHVRLHLLDQNVMAALRYDHHFYVIWW